MLLQSQNNEIYLLPALPDAWKSGTVKGLRARGGFEINIKWSAGEIEEATILSLNGNDCNIRTNTPVYIKALDLSSKKSSYGYELSFKTQVNKRYTLQRLR